MREIKFRAWDKTDKRMMYRDVFDRNWYATSRNDEAGCHCIRGISPDDRPIIDLMQYTGLKDKNGKDIYEGDIVRANKANTNWYGFSGYKGIDGLYEIVYHEGSVNFSGLYRTLIGQDTIEYMDIEVIGNIYENPELLEVVK